jgi:hypothetical protein
MSYRYFKFVLILFTSLTLTLASTAQAAPPLQEDGTTLGDSLNLDENGEPIDEGEESGGNNLGTIMSGDGETDDGAADDCTTDDGTTDDCTTDDGTTDDGATDDGTTDDGTTDDCTTGDGTTDDCGTDDGTTDEETDPTLHQHPVASAIADYFGVEYDEIITLHESGNSFGNIAKAYFFADKLELEPAELLESAHSSGWGNVLKENGLHPGSVGKGNDKQVETPDEPADTVETSAQPGSKGNHGGGVNPDLAGPGGGNGHGNGQGNGAGGAGENHSGQGNGGGNSDHGKGNGKDK